VRARRARTRAPPWPSRPPRARRRRDRPAPLAGFAFDASLLWPLRGEIWEYEGHGGESELIERLLPGAGPEALQPLANCGRDVLVFHNEYRILPVPMREPRTACGADGSGLANASAPRPRPD
jgi:hypothetical protein